MFEASPTSTMDDSKDLSVIIPYVNEYPQNVFTVQGIVNQLRQTDIDFEIVLINNYCDRVAGQGKPEDKGREYFEKLISNGVAPYLRHLNHPGKLSSWACRSLGAAEAKGRYLLYCDAHVCFPPDALWDIYSAAVAMEDLGTLHFPIAYMNDAPGNELIYRMRYNHSIGLYHYVFHKTPLWERRGEAPFQVPCMSACGMLIPRYLLVFMLYCWPSEFGIYGGGENYLNYTLAVLGYEKMVLPGYPIQHYAEQRGYFYDGQDWLRNRMIAVYLSGGEALLRNCVDGMQKARKGSPRALRMLAEEVLYSEELENYRKRIRTQQVIALDEWAAKWEGHELAEKRSEWI